MGGAETQPNSIPYQGALVWSGTNRVHCGGTILNKKFVLTAAHCFDLNSYTNHTFQVIAGEHDLLNNNDSATRHDIANITLHSNWKYVLGFRKKLP